MTPTSFHDWLTTTHQLEQSIIVTANERLARSLIELTFELHRPDVKIMSLNAFIQAHWENAQNHVLEGSHAHLLTAQQSLYIWQQLIAQHKSADENLIDDVIKDDFMIVNKLYEAYNTHKLWQLPPEELSLDDNKQITFYLTLKTYFEQACQQKHWITSSDASLRLTEYFAQQHLAPYSQLALYGFNDISPAEQALFDTSSHHTTHITLPHKTATVTGHVFDDAHDELTAIALWAKHHYTSNPSADIGIIMPNLHQKKHEIETVFSRIFEPQQHVSVSPTHTAQLPYEVTLGNKLIDEPVIQSVFLLFNIHSLTIDMATAHSIIQSPFWGEANSPARAYATQKLSRWNRSNISTTQLMTWLTTSKTEREKTTQFEPDNSASKGKVSQGNMHLENMDLENTNLGSTNLENTNVYSSDTVPPCQQAILAALTLFRRAQNTQSSLETWRLFLHEWLKALHWPGTRTVNSREYQAIMMFMALLDELREDDLFALHSPNKSYNGFISHLKSKTNARVFKIQTDPKPIKIMGSLEAIGLQFEHCWISNVSTDQFPEKPNPNPFLPYNTQKQYGTPRASAEKELHYAQTVLSGFCHNANSVIFSYAKHHDNSEQLPTPLLQDHVTFTPHSAQVTTLSRIQTQQQAQPALIVNTAENGMPLDIPFNEKIKSGVKTIENTAASPLWAYFIHRLGAQQPENTYVGLSPIDKGMIIHDVAAALWHDYPNKTALLTLFESKSQEPFDQTDPVATEHCLDYISHKVNHALLTQLQHVRGLLPKALLELEKTRLAKALLRFLLEDIQRPDFTVQAVEKNQDIRFNVMGKPLTFSITLDRIDRLPNDQVMVIDYKTGNSEITDTLKSPLANAQLPVYSLIHQTSAVNAVSFARIATHGACYLGLGELTPPVEGVDQAYLKKWPPNSALAQPENFDELKAHWETLISDYLTQFCRGDAAHHVTSPKPYHAYLNVLTRDFEQDYLHTYLEQSLKQHPQNKALKNALSRSFNTPLNSQTRA